MNKKILILVAFLLLSSLVMADTFIHEGDHNYSIADVGITPKPNLNNYLVLDFNIINEGGQLAKNTHVHIIVSDDRNALVQDYSVKLRDNSKIDSWGAVNEHAIVISSGYSYYRRLYAQGLDEHRIVSNDDGRISVQLFLNGCGINESKGCYLQTGVYRARVIQSELKHDEYFTVQPEKIQSFFFIQFLSMITNNAKSIAMIFLFVAAGIIFISALIWWAKGRFFGK